MTDTTSTAAEPARSADAVRQSPGEYLRRLREEKGHNHAAVSTALHLTVHYIKALENDEYGKLPGLTFVKGYLRSYARFLGSDVDSVLARFDEHITGLLDAGKHTARVERSKRRQDQALRWAIGAGIVVVAGLAAGWWFVSGGQDEPEVAQRTTPAAAQTVNPTAPPAATTPPAVQTRAPAAPAASTFTPATASYSGTEQAPAQTATAPVTATGTATLAADVPTATATPAIGGSRNVSLISSGSDQLQMSFQGNSWIEVDDGSMVRLYNDMLRAGDTLTIRGTAPFHVLLGNAAQVQVSLNAAAVDISKDIRGDNTARLVLGGAGETTAGAEVQP